MSEHGLSKNQVIAELTKSPHGQLEQYATVGIRAANEDPLFYSRLIAWNQIKGAIRDAKVALPVLALTSAAVADDLELRENAMAHIAKLDPRNLIRAVRFAKSQPVKSRKAVIRLAERYLRDREASPGRFERAVLQHRQALREIYALLHIKPSTMADAVLFKGEKPGLLGVLAGLKDMTPAEAAGTILTKRIPFLAAQGALGVKAKDPAIVQALIEAMSPTEVVTNAKMLERLGVKDNPALRATFEAALAKVAQGTSTAATLKTTRAAEMVGGTVGEKLRGVQEKQLDNLGVEGDWLVLGDRSGSMRDSIAAARKICAVLARAAKGRVHLVFFNGSPEYFDVTGADYDKILAITKRVTPGGGTHIGCGMQYLADRGIVVNGVAVVSDGGERGSPNFAVAYRQYEKKMDVSPTVYLYKVAGDDPDWMSQMCRVEGVGVEVFDLTGGLDEYSLPNLVATMRTSRFSLLDEINNTPLMRLSDVFKQAA